MPPLTVVALLAALLGVAAHSAWLSRRIDALEARGTGTARRWPSRARSLGEGSGEAGPFSGRPVVAGSPEVVPYESFGDPTWSPSPIPEEESHGVAVHVEQAGAAIVLRAPTAPDWFGAPSPTASSPPSSEMDLLMFATSVRSGTVSGDDPANNESNWLSDPLGDSASRRIVRAPHCRSLLSHHRCKALGQDSFYPLPNAGPVVPPQEDGVGRGFMPALVVAGDTMVLGRITSPTIDALVETVAALRSQLLALAAASGEAQAPTQPPTPTAAPLPEASLATLVDQAAELQLFSAAAVSNGACHTDWNKTRGLSVSSFADGVRPLLPTVPLLRSCGLVSYITSPDSGLPMSALTGVPSAWGRVDANGIRLHAAVMVDVARAAAVPMARGARRFAWLYVTGGFDRQLCWGAACMPNEAIAHSYRLDMVTLRWEALPALPMARARHGMAWLPELGVVAAGPGQVYDEWNAWDKGEFGRYLFPASAEPFVDILAVPEAFDAVTQWSAPARVHATTESSLNVSDSGFMYTSAGATNASGRPQFAVPSASWAAAGGTVSPLVWQAVGNLSEAFPGLRLSGMTNASLTSIGTKVYLYGGGMAVQDMSNLRPQLAVLQVDLGQVRMTGSGLRAHVKLLCSTPVAWMFNTPLIGNALFPAPAGNRLLAFGGLSLGFYSSTSTYDISTLDGNEQHAVVIDLDSSGHGGDCFMVRSDDNRDNWAGFGAARLANGQVVAAGGARTNFAQAEAEVYRLFEPEASMVTPLLPTTTADEANVADLPVLPHNKRLIGGVMAAMPAAPATTADDSADLIARLEKRDGNGTRLGPAAPWQATTLTQELWWFGGDPILEWNHGYEMESATGSYLRRLGGDWNCGELGAARREAAASAQALHATTRYDLCGS